MQRLEDGVQLNADEQIIGDFYGFLRDERGMTVQSAVAYLLGLAETVIGVMTPEFLDYSEEGRETEAEDKVRAYALIQQKIAQRNARIEEVYVAPHNRRTPVRQRFVLTNDAGKPVRIVGKPTEQYEIQVTAVDITDDGTLTTTAVVIAGEIEEIE